MGAAGSVTSMICIPSLVLEVTMAYVRPSIPNTSMSSGPDSAVKPSVSSKTAETGMGAAGSVTSMIWTPPSR